MKPKEREVIQLLQDYTLKYPSGSQGVINFEAMDATYSSGWPLNAESVKRLGNGLVAQTYRSLELALQVLRGDDPQAYSAIRGIYLVEEASPSDLSWLKARPKHAPIVAAHDRGIKLLAQYLQNSDLYVRWPKRGLSVEAKKPKGPEREEVTRIVAGYKEEGLSVTQAVRNTATLTGLSERTIWRAYKAHTQAQSPSQPPVTTDTN